MNYYISAVCHALQSVWNHVCSVLRLVGSVASLWGSLLFPSAPQLDAPLGAPNVSVWPALWMIWRWERTPTTHTYSVARCTDFSNIETFCAVRFLPFPPAVDGGCACFSLFGMPNFYFLSWWHWDAGGDPWPQMLCQKKCHTTFWSATEWNMASSLLLPIVGV